MTKSVRNQSAAVMAQSRHWPLITALLGGTATMREAGETFLPKWPNEEQDSYNTRIAIATLYPAFSRTAEVLASKPFSKPVALQEDVPPRIAEWMQDCDLQGHNLHVFSSQLLRDCIDYGVSGVLVDYPPANGIKTQADEKATGVRPYFTRYAPGTVLGWRTERISGSEKLIQVRLLETVTEYVGDFGEQSVEQVRVLSRGQWQVWRKADKAEEWFLFDEGTTTINEIPFVFFYGIRKSTGVGEAPLIELAYQNIEHWQSCSDQQTILHVARVPILAIIGADTDTQITVGAKNAVKIPQGGEMKFVEHSGAAIGAGRQSILDLEERMRQTGAELLVLKPGDVTATQVQSENEANRCALQRIVEDFEDSLDQCLQFMAMWVNEPEGGHVTLFKDFGAANLAEASAELLLKSNQAGKLSDETYFGELKRRGIVTPDATWEDEQEKIAEQGPALGTMSEGDPVIDPAPIDPVEPVEQQTLDLSPVLDAIAAIEKPEPSDDSELKASIASLSQQVADLSAQVAEPQTAELDLSPVNDAIAALAEKGAQLETNEEPDDADEVRQIVSESIAPLLAKIAELSAKPEAKEPDLEALRNNIMRDVTGIVTQMQQMNQPQPVIILDQQTGQVKKQITIKRDAENNIIGAEMTPQTLN